MSERAACVSGKANQHDAGRLVSSGVRKLAEVLVFGQKDSPFGAGESQDHIVLGARIDLHDSTDVVAGGAEGDDDGEVAALVGEETHRLVLAVGGAFAEKNDLFVRKCVGGVAHRRVDVRACEARVGIKKLRL